MKRMKELFCVLFGHDWTETGSKKCMEHNQKYAEYEICGQCNLQKNIGNKYCTHCYDIFFEEAMRK